MALVPLTEEDLKPNPNPRAGKSPPGGHRRIPAREPLPAGWASELSDLDQPKRAARVLTEAQRLYDACIEAQDWREARQTLAFMLDLAPKAKGAGGSSGESPL